MPVKGFPTDTPNAGAVGGSQSLEPSGGMRRSASGRNLRLSDTVGGSQSLEPSGGTSMRRSASGRNLRLSDSQSMEPSGGVLASGARHLSSATKQQSYMAGSTSVGSSRSLGSIGKQQSRSGVSRPVAKRRSYRGPAKTSLSFHDVSWSKLGQSSSSASSSEAGSSTDGDGLAALRDVHGVALAGELVAFVEPGGAGGSTLLRLLCGVDAVTNMPRHRSSGVVVVEQDGQREEQPMGSLQQAGLASFVTHEDALRGCLTVRETLNSAAALRLPDKSPSDRTLQIDQILRDLRMEHLVNDMVDSLSAGERRRLSVGCDALLSCPSLIFIDDPTEGLYLHDAQLVCRCLRDIARGTNCTFVISLREPTAEIMIHMDRVTLLAFEKMVFSGKLDDLRTFLVSNGHMTPQATLDPISAAASAAGLAGTDASELKTLERVLELLSHPGEAIELAKSFTTSDYYVDLQVKRNSLGGTNSPTRPIRQKTGHNISTLPIGGQIYVLLKREATIMWREGSSTKDVLRTATLWCVIFGLIAWQVETTASSARTRLNLLGMLIDLPSFLEVGWTSAYIASRQRNERDVASGVVTLQAVSCVWIIMTILRASAVTAPVMVVAWPMMSMGGSFTGWLVTFGLLLMAKTIMLMFFLLFSIRANSQEEAVALMGPVFLLWYQCRGWFVRKDAGTVVSQWLMYLNPARSVWQRMSVLIFKGEELPCAIVENSTTYDNLQHVCPMSGDLLLQQNSFVDNAFNDVMVCGLWILFSFYMFYRGIFTKRSGTRLKGPVVICILRICCRYNDGNRDAHTRDAGDGAAPRQSHKRHSSPDDTLARSLSVDVNEIDAVLNATVNLTFEGLRCSTVTRGIAVRNASGNVRPGQLMVVLGPSSSQKSSLLQALAGYGMAEGDISGSIRVNGRVCDNMLQSRIAAYVPQEEDTWREVLTVQESLQHAANMELGHTSSSTRSSLIFDVLRGLRLYKKRGKLISELNASEKRRLSIGTSGLLTPSRLLLLDDPCRGLLPTDELAVMRLLSDLCNTYQYTIVFSANHPQSEVMALVDQVLLLSGTATLFSGPRSDVPGFFADAGFAFKGGRSDVQEMLAVASDKNAAMTVSNFFANRHCGVHPSSPRIPGPIETTGELDYSTGRAAPFPRTCANEFWCLIGRDIRVQLREPMTAKLFLFNIIAMAGSFALLYWRFDQNAENIMSISGTIWNAQSAFQTLVLTSSIYHQLKWCPAQKRDTCHSRSSVVVSCTADFLVTSFRLLLGGAIFAASIFFATGLDAGANDFIGVVLPLAAVGLSVDALVFCFVCCSSNPEHLVDEILPSVVYMLNALGGYFIEVSLMPGVFQWLAACSPIAAAYSLSMLGYFNGITVSCGYVEANASQTLSCPVQGGTTLRILGVPTDQEAQVWNIALLALWPLAFRSFGALVISRGIRTRRAQMGKEIDANTKTCGYRATANLLAKPILKVFYRDIAVVGLENLPNGTTPTLVAFNQSNLAMDPILMVALSCSIDRPIFPMLPQKYTVPDSHHSQDVGGQKGPGLRFMIHHVRVVHFQEQTFASSYGGRGIIHKIYISDGQWGIEGALFQRDLEEGCRVAGPWGEPLHVRALVSDTEALIYTPTYPERLIPNCTKYKKRLVLSDDGKMVHTNAKLGPWKYKVVHEIDKKEAYRNVIDRLHSGSMISFPPESWGLDGDSPFAMGRFRTDFATVGLTTAAMVTDSGNMPAIVPVMLRWMNPHKMRSRAIVEVGEPITIDQKMLSEYAADPHAAAQALTDQLRGLMDDMQAPAKDTAELHLRRVIRRLVQKTTDITASEYCKLMRFVWRRDRELRDPTTPKEQERLRQYLALLHEAREYDAKRAVLGVPDQDIRNGHATRHGAVLCAVALCQSLLALLSFAPALPGAVLCLPPILFSNYQGKQKTRAVAAFQIQDRFGVNESTEAAAVLTSKPWLQNMSMVAFGRLSAGMVMAVLFVVIYTIAVAIIAGSDTLPVKRWFALFVPVSVPVIVGTTIWCLDRAAAAATAARSAMAALVASSTTLAELTDQRMALVERTETILGMVEHDVLASQWP